MTVACAECGDVLEPLPPVRALAEYAFDDSLDESDPLHGPYHWSCLQERYERERLAEGED